MFLIGFATAAALVGMFLEFFWYVDWAMFERDPQQFWNVMYAAYGVGAACLAILQGVLMSFALRVKLGGWWKNTLVWRILVLAWRLTKWAASWCWRGLKALGRGIRRVLAAVGRFLRDIPLVWKGLLAIGGICAIEFFAFLVLYDHGELLIFWFIEHLILVPVLLFALIQMRKLQKEMGVNPLAGCLPLLVQMPVFLGLFHVLRSFNRTGTGAGSTERSTPSSSSLITVTSRRVMRALVLVT